MLFSTEFKTIGSAEKNTSKEEMKEKVQYYFRGRIANILYAQFRKERVENELEEFLKKRFL